LSAESGVRAEALEHRLVFERPEFIALAERLDGDGDVLHANGWNWPRAGGPRLCRCEDERIALNRVERFEAGG
jgi:hypothetical protein